MADADSRGALSRAPRILFVVNVDWFFLSHRLAVALAARDAGYDVWVAAADTGSADIIREHGLTYVEVPFDRTGTSVADEARTVAALVKLYRRTRPDLLHHVTVKPVLYGAIAARLSGRPAVVNAIAGLGYAFSSGEGNAMLRRAVLVMYRMALSPRRSRTIFQNPEDMKRFVDAGIIAPQRAVLIRGSGVDCSAFSVTPEPDGAPIVLLAARMLREKGLEEFVEAARTIRNAGSDARFVLVGAVDSNPTGVPRGQLEEWNREGVIEWWGHRSDMPAVLSQATIVALPTYYREGLPKVLIEGAAAGRPLVATDIPGCREIVRAGVNGILIPPRDPVALADAINALLGDAEMRKRFGDAGRRMVEAEFTVEQVVRQTLDVYSDVLGTIPASAAA